MVTIDPYVDYVKALERIKGCIATHEHCPAFEETCLPTRVIDCSDPTKPRLVETNREIRGYYATLSYVWGGNQIQKTTTANIDTYHHGINVPLPQTIADAISMVNKLGVRYLWVDALCIIQDSNEDKDKELGIMAQIYRDSSLAISVLSAFRADQGFLPDERPLDVLPYFLADRSVPAGGMMIEYNIPRQTTGYGKYETVVMHRPLEERGWCLQESVLSPRKLIFQPPNAFYKCRSFSEQSIAHPALEEEDLPEPAPAPVKDHVLFPTNQHSGSADPVDNGDIQDRWHRLLLEYSKCKITVPSDKFVAFASIVEVFQPILNDQYVAGLWRRTLLRDLLWEAWPPIGPDEAPLPRPTPYRAPTWSWASIDRHLSLTSRDPHPSSAASYEADILACEATPKVSALPFGELIDARLTLRAKMHPLMRDGRKCTFIERKGTRWVSGRLQSFKPWTWTPPVGNCLEPRDFLADGTSEEEQEEKRAYGFKFDCAEGTEQDHPKEFYVIILRGGRNYRNEGNWMEGLLVLRVDGEEEQYRRVAKLDLQYHFEWPDWFDDMPLKMVTLV